MIRKYIKLLLTAALTVAAVISLAVISIAANDDIYTYAVAGNENTIIYTQDVDGQTYLFLPSNTDLENVALYFGGGTGVLEDSFGQKVQITSGVGFNASYLRRNNGVWQLKLTQNGTTTEFSMMCSQGIDSVFITSDDPVEHGREWVESSADKSNKAKGSLVCLNSDGESIYDGALSQIKGRGHSTWTQAKKPYQIKLKTAADLLDTGLEENECKTWLLIANYYDASMLRNAVTFDFSAQLGLESTIEYCFTDLYYDGQYRGTYLLTEKVEVNSGRVDIADLDKANESANPNYDFDSPTTQRAETSFGTSCQYVVGLDDPEDISGGYLLEMEMENRIDEEVSWFSTKGGDYLLTKSPEYATKAQLEYVSSLYQQFEDAVYNGGINPDTGKSYTEYMDLDSLVRCYLIMELSGNSECFLNSTYFYLPQGSDVFYAGPLWDYDLAYCVKSTEIRAGQSNLGRELLRLSDFCARAREIYEEEFLPIINSALSDGGAIDRYAQTLASSASMNFTLWPYTAYGASAYGGQSFQGNVDYLENYIRVRSEFLSEALQALPAQFDDVAIDAWYFPYVSRMYANGFINGTDKKTFSPNASLTRAQAVEMLYRMYGSDTDYSGIYSDIPDGLYYSRSVVWASKNSLVQGYDGGVFYPDKAISREQLALILYRAAGQPEADTSILSGFSDSADISTYARSAVAWACEKGIIGGSGGKLNPKNSAMRSQCAKMLDTFYRLYPSIEIG